MTIELTSHHDANELFQQIETICGNDFQRCFQCGSCASSCPMMAHMDASPRKVIHLLQFGLSDRLAVLKTPWICATCLSCQAVCPRRIDIPRIMEALRLLRLRRQQDYIEPSRNRLAAVADFPQIALIGAFRKLAS